MAKLIVLEGIERCGKTTIGNLLNDANYGNLLSIKIKQPDDVSFEQLGLYYHGMHMFSKELYKSLSDSTFILDRFYLSEFVYSSKFNRKNYMNFDMVKSIHEENEVITFYLRNTYQNYLDRSPKNKKILSSNDYAEMQRSFDFWINKFSVNEIPGQFININTNELSQQQVFESIKDVLNGKK